MCNLEKMTKKEHKSYLIFRYCTNYYTNLTSKYDILR